MKKYFVVLGYEEEHHNPKWDKKDAIAWGREMAEQGNEVKIYEAELIEEFDVEIKVIKKSKGEEKL